MNRRELKELIDKQILKSQKFVTIADKISTLNKKVDNLILLHNKKLDKPKEDFSFPNKVESIVELKQYINRAFGVHYIKKQLTPRRIACAAIRDSLALHYDSIERLNNQEMRHGYMAADEHHQDTIYVLINGKWYIIDFCIASKENGTLENNLCWNVKLETPWENKHE